MIRILAACLAWPSILLLLAAPAIAADSGEQCRKSLSIDGKLASGADPDLVAEACLAAATKTSNALASYMAGMVLEQGIGHGKDLVKAENWYRIAAERGEPKAMLALGRVPRTGDVFEHGEHRFEVVDMDANRVDRVLVSLIAPDRTHGA